MKIKRSKKLNNLMQLLYNNYEFDYIDTILIKSADHYTISGKVRAENEVQNGFRLALIAQKKNKPVYEVECYSGDFSAYFIAELDEIEKIFEKQIKLAKNEKSDR
jgi:hypothetical protein